MTLQDKNVLLIAPSFYGYEKAIVKQMQDEGANVVFISGHPSSFFQTMVGVVKKVGLKVSFLVRAFEKNIQRKISDKQFDVVVVINSQYVTSDLIRTIKQKHLRGANSKMVLYYWDSLRNVNDDRKRWNYFDGISVFDRNDYEENRDKVSFLPLFYIKDYWRKDSNSIKYDVMLVGTFRLNRYDFVKEVQKNNPTLKVGSYLYCKKWVIIFHKLFRRKYNHVLYSDLKYQRLSFEDVADIYMSGKAVLDIPMKGQNGLTIRTIESLAMHKKIITSNENIKQYDFYSIDNVFVLPENSTLLPSKLWFDGPFTTSDEIIKNYSLEMWLKRLLTF